MGNVTHCQEDCPFLLTPVIFPGGVVDDNVDDAGDGNEEVEDGKDEHQADFLQASAADAQQS